MTVSAPQRVAQVIFSTSSSMEEVTARVADVGVDLDQEVAADDHRLALGVVDVRRDDRPAARDLARTNSGVMPGGRPKGWALAPKFGVRPRSSVLRLLPTAAYPGSPRTAMNSISGVMTPRVRAVTALPDHCRGAPSARRHRQRGITVPRDWPVGGSASVYEPRARIQGSRRRGSPSRTSTDTPGSV